MVERLQAVHVAVEFLKCDTGVDLCGADVGVPQHTADTLNGQSGIETHDGKGVTGRVEGDVTADATLLHDERNMLGKRTIDDWAKDAVFAALIAAQYVSCLRQQPYLIRCVGLLADRHNPALTAYEADVLAAEVVDVGKRKSRQG